MPTGIVVAIVIAVVALVVLIVSGIILYQKVKRKRNAAYHTPKRVDADTPGNVHAEVGDGRDGGRAASSRPDARGSGGGRGREPGREPSAPPAEADHHAARSIMGSPNSQMDAPPTYEDALTHTVLSSYAGQQV